ncbi:MAG: PadR family transcriptional regulator [Hyphomicrobiaceae bacterium]
MNSRTLCLGILKFGEATGYEINKMASEGRFSHFIEASYGSIYPALTRLTKEGLVTWREEQIPGNPPRKVYAITDDGITALTQALMEEPRWDVFKSEFLFLNLFEDLVPAQHMEAMRNTRITALDAELERLHEAADTCDHPGSQFAIGYGIALTSAAVEYLRDVKRNNLERSDAQVPADPPATTVAAE